MADKVVMLYEARNTHSGSIRHLSIGESSSHKDEPLPQLEVVEEFIHDDAEKLREQFKSAYLKIQTELSRPHVLIAGNSGAGKSSIINSVFGSNIAKEGAGKPITQNFTKYCPEHQPIVLFDSKGLESGMVFEDFLHTTLEFFANNEKDLHHNDLHPKYKDNAVGLEKKVHLVWYVVNAAGARFQPFEERVCKELFGRIPIVFLLNKSDIASPSQLKALHDVIESMKLPNCIGIVESVTCKYAHVKAPEACGQCGAKDDLVIMKKTKMALCEICGRSTPFVKPSGLHDVLNLTFKALPNIAKESFVASQKMSFKLKDQRSRRIISEFYHEQSNAFTSQGLGIYIAKMLTRLSLVWDFRDHGHLYASHIARDIVSSFSIRDKIFLFVHKNKHQQLRATAIGIIWNRCVRSLAKILLVESVEAISESKIQEHWPLILEDAFSMLNEDELDIMEQKLKEASSLEEVLAEEDLPMYEEASIRSSSVDFLLSECGADCGSWDGFISSDPSPKTSPNASPRGSPPVKKKHRKTRSGSSKRAKKSKGSVKRKKESKKTTEPNK